MLAACRAGWPTARMTAPATTLPSWLVSGTDPGAAIRARALRTWCRHCRRSKLTAEPGDAPPVPVSMERIRRDQAKPPAARPNGIAVGAMTPAAGGYAPAAPRCHMASHAKYGEVTRRDGLA